MQLLTRFKLSRWVRVVLQAYLSTQFRPDTNICKFVLPTNALQMAGFMRELTTIQHIQTT